MQQRLGCWSSAGNVLDAVDPRRQPLLPLHGDVSIISLLNRDIIPGNPRGDIVRMVLKERSPRPVSTQPHALDLGRLEGVHGDRAHEGDVHAETAVHARAGQTEEDAEFGGGPLGGGRGAVDAARVGVGFGDLEELRWRG